jgi:hypothetical protein
MPKIAIIPGGRGLSAQLAEAMARLQALRVAARVEITIIGQKASGGGAA